MNARAHVFAPDAKLDCPAPVRAMLERQALAWITGDFGLAAADWHPKGALFAPGNRVDLADLPRTITEFHRDFGDLEITITSAFASAGGGFIGLEWLWTVSRRSDGARSVTPDGIIVELRDRLILRWHEYFDTAGAVEDHHTEVPA